MHPRIPLPNAAPDFAPGALEALEAAVRQWTRHSPVSPHSVDTLLQGQMTFLHHTESFGRKYPWLRTDLPRLWRYNLHYFDYARMMAMAAATRKKAGQRDWTLSIIQDWIRNNPPGTDVAWDAFTIAARLMNWALAEAVFHFNDPLMRKSFQQQARYLACSLEYDVRANHLLREAASLVLADSLLGGKRAMKHLRLLESQVQEQILPDGGHYERSPMYHCQVMQDLILVYAILRKKPAYLRDAIGRMAEFLESILHPDGDIPLFGDSALGQYAPRTLIHLARETTKTPAHSIQQGCYALLPSGFYVFSEAKSATRMIVKAGIAGPPYQLGHAHADAGSYEFCLGRDRIIVDSGVHGYAGSPFRHYSRSTHAHNIVSVNGSEQLELWGSFRVGRRMPPPQVTWRELEGMNELVIRQEAGPSFQHERRILQSHEGFWRISDAITGSGTIKMSSYVHFHPDVQVQETREGWILTRDQVLLALVPLSQSVAIELVQGESSPQQGWYFPEFGLARPNPVLVFQTQGVDTASFIYAIVSFATEKQRLEKIQHAVNWHRSSIAYLS
ncbi:MAG TPA: alginate lyase family protein [Candidatus Hydrogenedentes bacterium]|nr:alginate lyase family protein [Candidatus Hydrogenedentota bacterium]